MFKICTVLFVASMGTVVSAMAASPSEIAELLNRYKDSTTPANADLEGARPALEELGETCPHLAQLRTTEIASALGALYQQNDYAPFWDDQHRLDALHDELARLAHDGLSVDDYPYSQQASGKLDLCAELRVSSEYLLALEHLGVGRLDQQSHEPMERNEQENRRDPAISRWTRAGLSDVSAAFNQARPSLALYLDLRRAYVRLLDEQPEYEPIASGELLRPGDEDPRVPQLARRLEAGGYLDSSYVVNLEVDEADITEETTAEVETGAETQLAESNTLNPRLVAALKDFQQDHGLKTDGVLGPNTLAALNLSLQHRMDLVRINLERLRWVNALLDDEALLVNSANNLLRHYHNGEQVWQTRVITGRPGRETPMLVSRLERITLNPDWTVPPTIRKEDMHPAIRKDLAYLERKNLHVIDYQGNRLDPESIDWNDPRGTMIRQPPGPSNPLGQVVFRFDNSHAVYLHDTPDRQLFTRSQRNISSGCVRVEGAEALADTLFGRMATDKRERVERQRASRSTHQVAVEQGPQVILGYWTAEADTDGRLLLSQDPYDMDQALLAAFAQTAIQQPALR